MSMQASISARRSRGATTTDSHLVFIGEKRAMAVTVDRRVATHDAWRWLAFAAATVATLVLATPAAAQDVGLPIGTQAPAAQLETLDGGAANLSSYIGKSPVLIEFWATWCPNCKALEPHMQEVAKKYGDRVEFIAVAVSVNQSPQRVKLYAEKYKLPMTMLYDRKGEATDAYEAPATSYIVILDSAGKVVYTGLGDDQDLDAALGKVVN